MQPAVSQSCIFYILGDKCAAQVLLSVSTRFPVFDIPEIRGILSHSFKEERVIIWNDKGVYEVNQTDCFVILGSTDSTASTLCHTTPESIYHPWWFYPKVVDVDVLKIRGKHSLLFTTTSRHCIDYVDIDSDDTEVVVKKYLGHCDSIGNADGYMDEVKFHSPTETLVKTEVGALSSLWVKIYYTHPDTFDMMHTTCNVSSGFCVKEEAFTLQRPVRACLSQYHDTVAAHSSNNRLEVQTGNVIITLAGICLASCTFLSDAMYFLCAASGTIRTTDLKVDMITGTVVRNVVTVVMDDTYVTTHLKLLESYGKNSLITYSPHHQSILVLSDLFCYRTAGVRGSFVSKLHQSHGDCGSVPFQHYQTLNLDSCFYFCVAASNCNSITFDKVLGVCKLHACYRQEPFIRNSHLQCLIIG